MEETIQVRKKQSLKTKQGFLNCPGALYEQKKKLNIEGKKKHVGKVIKTRKLF